VKNYAYIVVDNEAGMEHFSRKTAARIDLLFFCSNYSIKGIKTAGRLSKMVDDLRLDVGSRHLIITMAPGELDPGFMAEIEKTGIPFIGHIERDEFLAEADVRGSSIMDLPEGSAALRGVSEILDRALAMKAGSGAI